jgi:hypothetical protein
MTLTLRHRRLCHDVRPLLAKSPLISTKPLFRPQVEWLLTQRDLEVKQWQHNHPNTGVYEDRSLDITSYVSADRCRGTNQECAGGYAGLKTVWLVYSSGARRDFR